MTLAVARFRFEPARARGPWRGADKRCRWMARERARFPIELVRVTPRLALVDEPIQYRMRVAGLDKIPESSAAGWVGTQAPVRIVRHGRQWVTPGGVFPRKELAVASALDEVFETTPEEAARWAAQGWIPAAVRAPWFLPFCWGGITRGNPDDGCPDCAHLDWARVRLEGGKRIRWR